MRRKYLHVGLTVASMLQTILNTGYPFHVSQLYVYVSVIEDNLNIEKALDSVSSFKKTGTLSGRVPVYMFLQRV